MPKELIYQIRNICHLIDQQNKDLEAEWACYSVPWE